MTISRIRISRLAVTAMMFATVISVSAIAGAVRAGTLENLERERALLVETLISGDVSQQERQKKVALARARLIDLERMVLRDKSLASKNTPAVRAAFDNYDLTFMVHASVEKNRMLMDHWLQQVGVSTQSLMNTRMGRR
jgi:hypothetical protein